jgi:hypothetical protein
MVFVPLFLLVPISQGSEDTSPGGQLNFKVGIINNTPGYQLEVTIDGTETSIINNKQTKTYSLSDKETKAGHQVVAKAFTLTKPLGRRQIGKVCTITFQVTGEVKSSPAGKVVWYKTFTYEDFFPHLGSFRTEKYSTRFPRVSTPVYKAQSHARHQDKLEIEYICDLIRQVSEKYRIPMALLAAIIEVESAFDARSISQAGALGLMQLMPETCSRFDVHRPFDPQENIEGGAKYLSYLLHQWSLSFPSHRRLEISLAAYNAGEQAVGFHGGIPPFKETKNYVKEVLKKYTSSQECESLVH